MVKNKKVLIALSGGADSAVSAFLLKKLGYQVIAIYFDMLEKNDEYEKAKKIAEFLEIRLIRKNIRASFKKEVIGCFIDEYRKNRTPNPCVACNPKIKFSNLLKLANETRADYVATGHYAKIAKRGDKYLLQKAKDEKKDQTYFLYRLAQGQLGRVIFPLANIFKQQVKKIAKKNRIPVSPEESQNVCFFKDGENLGKFLKKYFKASSGEIQDETGKFLGKHGGLELYTSGQRFGLGLCGGPYFVTGKDIKKNILLVSKNRNHPLIRPRFARINKSIWIAGQPIINKKYQVKSRYQAKETPSKVVKKISDGGYIVDLGSLQWAPATGQSLVFYDGDTVAGGGIVDKIFCVC